MDYSLALLIIFAALGTLFFAGLYEEYKDFYQIDTAQLFGSDDSSHD